MTRINVVPVEELSDQHLLAEYHELPRVVKKQYYTGLERKQYHLGKGHVIWARRHLHYLLSRYHNLCNEMQYRGFKVNHPWKELMEIYLKIPGIGGSWYLNYLPTDGDLKLNKDKLLEKYKLKPTWYRWTKRSKPKYYDSKC